MAAEPVLKGELAALRGRVGRDLAELRRRMRARRAPTVGAPDDLLGAVVEVARGIRAVPGLSERAGIAWITALGAAAGIAVGRSRGAFRWRSAVARSIMDHGGNRQ